MAKAMKRNAPQRAARAFSNNQVTLAALINQLCVLSEYGAIIGRNEEEVAIDNARLPELVREGLHESFGSLRLEACDLGGWHIFYCVRSNADYTVLDARSTLKVLDCGNEFIVEQFPFIAEACAAIKSIPLITGHKRDDS